MCAVGQGKHKFTIEREEMHTHNTEVNKREMTDSPTQTPTYDSPRSIGSQR